MQKQKNRRSSSPDNTEEVVRALNCPIDTLETVNEIYEFMKSKINAQDAAMLTIAEILMDMRNAFPYAEARDPKLSSIVLSGSSGSGKTESVRWIKHLLGMDHGYAYEHQYIQVVKEGSEHSDDPQTIHPITNTLFESLNDALQSYQPNHAKRSRHTPRFLLLCIDNLDTIPASFMESITPILVRGRTRDESFRLPEETSMLIVSTCNYGTEAIRSMPEKINEDAILCVKAAMKDSHTLSENVMSRLGQIVPFYPLPVETLRVILMQRLEQFLVESPMCKPFGEITYDGNVKNLLVDKVIKLTLPGTGIRHCLSTMLDKVGDFFKKALRELHTKKMASTRAFLLRLDEIDLKKFDEKMEKECADFANEIMRCLLSDPRALVVIDQQRANNDKLEALSMSVNGDHLHSSQISTLGNANQHNNLFNRCEFNVSPIEVARLKEENLELKETLDKVDMLVQKAKGGSTSFYEGVKDIVTDSKKSLIRYQYGQSFRLTTTTTCKNRVEEINEDTMSSSSSSSSSLSEEEPLPKRPILKKTLMMRKYKHLDLNNLKDVSIDSDIDEDSIDDHLALDEHNQQVEHIMLKNLMKKYKNKKIICQGRCGEEKKATSFNPTLYRGKRVNSVHFRNRCNTCRKKH